MRKRYTPRDAAQVFSSQLFPAEPVDLSEQAQEHSDIGGHHRIREEELDHSLPGITSGSVESRLTFRRISGRDQLIGRVSDIEISGLLAQVTPLSAIKSTEVMIIRPN